MVTGGRLASPPPPILIECGTNHENVLPDFDCGEDITVAEDLSSETFEKTTQ
jgi:hypothetical protein